MFYASFDPRANLDNGNRGFANTVEIVRFPNRQERDAFVAEYANKLAEPLTRKDANAAFVATYSSVGNDAPAGGLFGDLVEWIDHDTGNGQTCSGSPFASRY